jgi:hypothetical protein
MTTEKEGIVHEQQIDIEGFYIEESEDWLDQNELDDIDQFLLDMY